MFQASSNGSVTSLRTLWTTCRTWPTPTSTRTWARLFTTSIWPPTTSSTTCPKVGCPTVEKISASVQVPLVPVASLTWLTKLGLSHMKCWIHVYDLVNEAFMRHIFGAKWFFPTAIFVTAIFPNLQLSMPLLKFPDWSVYRGYSIGESLSLLVTARTWDIFFLLISA